MSSVAELPAKRPAQSQPQDDAAYLLSKGWRRLGRRWLDPTKPLRDEYVQVQRKVMKLVDGKEVEGDMLVPDGLGQTVPCKQTVFRPAGKLVELQEALEIQTERDVAEGNG